MWEGVCVWRESDLRKTMVEEENEHVKEKKKGKRKGDAYIYKCSTSDSVLK